MERYRRASVRRNRNDEKPDFKTKLVRQSIVCLVILSTVFIVGLFKTKTAIAVADRIQKSISYTVDYKSTVKDIMSVIDKITKGTEDAEKTDTTN